MPTTANAIMEDQQSGQGTDGGGGGSGGFIGGGGGGTDLSPLTTGSFTTIEMKPAPLQAPAPMEPQNHYSDAETDDDDSFAAFCESEMLLKKYSATRRTGIQQHRRNSLMETEMDNKKDEIFGRKDSSNKAAGGNRRSSGIVVGRGERTASAATTTIPLRSPAGASSQQSAPSPQRRSIFPHMLSAAGSPTASQRDTQQKESKVSKGSLTVQQQQREQQQRQQLKRHVQHHRSHSFEQEQQTQAQSSQLQVTQFRQLQIPFPSNVLTGALDSCLSSFGDKSSASHASRPRLPSNEDLINAMDDKYEPDKSARHQQIKNRQVQPKQSLQYLSAASVGSASSMASRSGGDAGRPITYAIPPFRSNREKKHLRPATATEIVTGGKRLSGEAASGEIVCNSRPATSKYIPSSPRRKVSLFEGSTLPKVQHTPKTQPETPLTPRSPPRARDAINPLPSILRKTSSSFNSPIMLTSPRTAAAGGQKTMHRTTVSFGGGGSSALDELSNGSASSKSNARRPEVSRSSSAKFTKSELEHHNHPQQTQGMARAASRDESSAESSSTIRSNSSLRRVNSENSMVSSVETERKRVTAITLASVASAVSEKEKSFLTRHGSLEMCTALNKEISFDPRVWVVEYEQDEGSKWFNAAELERFKCEAIERIRRRHAQQQLSHVPSGTGRVIPVQMVQRTGSGRALFTDPALGCNEEGNDEDEEEDNDDIPAGSRFHVISSSAAAASIPSHVPPGVSASDERRIQRALLSEIRNILVVDPHDMFLKLFAKALHAMMSHVIVTTATSAEEALRRIAAARVVFPESEGGATHGFDIIIVEERLQLFQRHRRGAGSNRKQQQAAGDEQKQRQVPASGSALVNQIATEQQEALESAKHNQRTRFSLLIGVSAHIQLDGDKLSRAGADLVWGKPPPPFDDELRVKILRAVLSKRAKPIYF